MINTETNMGLIYTNDNCIGCNKCIKGCPMLGSNIAKKQEDDKSIISVDGSKCIHCGMCLQNCEHDARQYRDDFKKLKNDLASGEKITLLIAPSFFLNYEKNAANIIGYLRSLGFDAIYDVSFGANITTWAYITYLKKNNCDCMISSACPAIVDYIEKYKPELIDRLMPVQTPAHCLRTYLKTKKPNPHMKYAFLCPCVGKHDEYSTWPNGETMDYTIAFKTLTEHIRTNNINTQNFYGQCDEIMPPRLGAFYPIPGGLKLNMTFYIGESKFIRTIEGPKDVYPYLNYLSEQITSGKRVPYFVDALNCFGGCTQGMASEADFADSEMLSMKLFDKKSTQKLEGELSDPFLPPELRYEKLKLVFSDTLGLDYNDYLRSFNTSAAIVETEVSPEVIENVFLEMNKRTVQDRTINCTSCGYSSCKEMALAIAHGYNVPENCIHFAHNSLKRDRDLLETLLGRLNNSGDSLHSDKPDTAQIIESIARSIDEIESMRESLNNDVHLKSRFYASMTHELRSPLNAIITIAKMLSENPDAPDKADSIKALLSAANTLLDTTNELLDLSKLEESKIEIISEPYKLMDLINDVGTLIRFRSVEKKLTFTLLTNPSLPETLIGDSKRIRQILLNLLTNAIKYTAKGNVSLTTDWNQDVDNPVLTFNVADTGMGIREADLPYLFDAYARLDEKKNCHIEGTGLGLNISKSLADEMSGKLSVTSEYGVGSVFTLTIPQKISEYKPLSESKGVQTSAKDTNTLYHMPMARVLIVDDLAVNLQVASMLLDKYQCHTTLASSGKEALDLLEKETFDMIFLDYRMPEMNGLLTLQQIRLNKNEQISRIPVVLMTAEDEDFASGLSSSSDFRDYLAKPIDKTKLYELLLKYLPKDKIVPVNEPVLPPKNTFTGLIEAEDMNQYILLACDMERLGQKLNETKATHLARVQRIAAQESNISFLQANAPFLDRQIELFEEIMNKKE